MIICVCGYWTKWYKKWYTDKMVRTKWYMDKMVWTKWYEQNGIDKMVRTKWYTDKMVWAKWYTDKMVEIFCTVLIQLNLIYISNQKSQKSYKHTEETYRGESRNWIDEKSYCQWE